MFALVPLMHLLLVMTLIDLEYWYLSMLLGVVLYYPIHQLGQSIGYHKLFAHRAFDPVSWYPYVSTFFGLITFIGTPIGYSLIHRLHHRYSDTDEDPHNPQHGIFHAYIGWIRTYPVSESRITMVVDLLSKYKWLRHLWKFELPIICLFYMALFMMSKFVFCAVLLASLASMHNGLIVNAFSHIDGVAIDRPLLAKMVSPIFMHKDHHVYARSYDYSKDGVKDFSVYFIEKWLMKKSSE